MTLTDETLEAPGARTGRRRARFHRLRVVEVRPLTADAVEVTLAVPEGLADAFDYAPGQYVALRARIDGAEVRRSYSICRPPTPGRISVGIKRDPSGRFSSWAQTQLRPGDEIDVMSPQGTFVSTRTAVATGHVVGIAAGSGITPIMSLAAAVLAASATSSFTLVYANRSSTDVMFVDELADLKDRYPSRLAIHHVLSREQRTAPVLSGRIDEARLRRLLATLVPPETVAEWFLCGPFPLVQLCRDVLADVGVPSDRVRFELFSTGAVPAAGSCDGRAVAARGDEPVRTIEFTLDGTSSRVTSPVGAHETILAAALRVRGDVPFACAGGVCGTCRARLRDGAVQMTENYALEPDEIERGYILTCQSHPTSDRVVVDYDG